MMKSLGKLTGLIFRPTLRPLYASFVTAILLYFFLDKNQSVQYHFFEQRQIFAFGMDYFRQIAFQLGGLGIYISQFLVQFFVFPHAGAILTSVLAFLPATLMFLSMKGPQTRSYLLSVLLTPSLLLVTSCFDYYFSYSALVTYLAVSLLVSLYVLLAPRLSIVPRTIMEVTASLALYLSFGALSLSFPLALAAISLTRRYSGKFLVLLSLAFVLLLALVSVHMAWSPSFSEAMGLGSYVDHIEMQHTMHYIPWIVFPLSLVLFLTLSSRPVSSPYLAGGLFVACFLLLTLLFNWQCGRWKNDDLDNLQRVMDFGRSENWNAVLEDESVNSSLLLMNLRNLALSKKGLLLDDLLKHPQVSSKSLLVDHMYSKELDEIFSWIFLQCGHTSAAQYFAQDVFSSLRFGSPSLLKIIVKTKLAFGDYLVAEKYIRRLEKTLFYSSWATSMRRFLGDDAAVLEDPELGRLRRDLPSSQGDFLLVDGTYSDLVKIIHQNPSETAARDYILAMLVLDRQTAMLEQFLRENPQAFSSGQVPVLLQQALVALHEQDPGLCLQLGVSQKVLDRFQTFKSRVLQIRRNQGGNIRSLAFEYADTYWYYLMTAKQ